MLRTGPAATAEKANPQSGQLQSRFRKFIGADRVNPSPVTLVWKSRAGKCRKPGSIRRHSQQPDRLFGRNAVDAGQIRAALPPFPLTRDWDEVEGFLRRL